MATRTITRFMAYFDDAGDLLKFSAVGRIDTTDGYKINESYERDAAALPAGFVTDMEAIHGQIVTKLDNDFPVTP